MGPIPEGPGVGKLPPKEKKKKYDPQEPDIEGGGGLPVGPDVVTGGVTVGLNPGGAGTFDPTGAPSWIEEALRKATDKIANDVNAINILGPDEFKKFDKIGQPKSAKVNPQATGLRVMQSWMELSLPGIVFKPTHTSRMLPDLRNKPMPTKAELQRFDARTPVIGRIEPVGAQNGDDWTHTKNPRQGRYGGGTATGTAWVTPPETSAHDYINNTKANKVSDTGLGFTPDTRLSFGTPLKNGLNGNGKNLKLVGADLVLQTTNAVGAVTASVTLGGGGNCPCTPGLYGDGHAG